mmetsp:Transcript_2477/g.3724  ORF Transcript_2477/g.3724 Transcript_2477/m.3724 type:complete len:85 (-) Transcript_2477:78-332(-)
MEKCRHQCISRKWINSTQWDSQRNRPDKHYRSLLVIWKQQLTYYYRDVLSELVLELVFEFEWSETIDWSSCCTIVLLHGCYRKH